MMLLRKKGTVGVDIGSGLIKIAQVETSKKGYELTMFTTAPVKPGCIVDGMIADMQGTVSALSSLVDSAGIRGSDAVIGVSGHSSVIVKKITIPLMTEEDLSLSIRYEAEQYIPFDLDEVNLDFDIIGPSQDQEGQMDVLLVAVKKKVVEDYVDAVTHAGLSPAIVDIRAFALNNMFEINYTREPGRNIALIDIGMHCTSITLLNDYAFQFTRDNPQGCSLHSAMLQQNLGITADAAERIKKGETVEGVQMADALLAISNASDEIIVDIYKTYEYIRSSVGEMELHEIMLSGGAALLQGFSDQLYERLRLPVTIVDPLRNISLGGKVDAASVKKSAPIAAVAVGLALRRAGDR